MKREARTGRSRQANATPAGVGGGITGMNNSERGETWAAWRATAHASIKTE